jgi:hypothetical protein
MIHPPFTFALGRPWLHSSNLGKEAMTMSDFGRFTFEPVLNLVNGRPVGLEVLRSQARDQVAVVARNTVWGTRQLAEFDSGVAIASMCNGTVTS